MKRTPLSTCHFGAIVKLTPKGHEYDVVSTAGFSRRKGVMVHLHNRKTQAWREVPNETSVYVVHEHSLDCICWKCKEIAKQQ